MGGARTRLLGPQRPAGPPRRVTDAELDLEVSDPSGRHVYMIALRVQIMIEPARRTYDDATRAKLLELFGEPARWATTTRSLVWSQVDVLVPAFTGSTTVSVPIPCTYDLELAAAKYLHSLPDGVAPMALHFNGTIYYRGDDGGLQMVLVPWATSIDFRLPASTWRDAVEHYFPDTAWTALPPRRSRRSSTRSSGVDWRRSARRSRRCCGSTAMDERLAELVEALLMEGYALYPYTPTATKNATPSPFGTAYPPAYAETLASTFDHLELRIALRAPADAVLSAEVQLLAPVGENHRAEPHRLSIPGAMVGALAHGPAERTTTIRGEDLPPLEVRLTLAVHRSGEDEYEVSFRIENRTVVRSGLGRGEALARSLLSTHPVLTVAGGRFLSALERPCGSVNTYPVLAADDDSSVLGAAIVLPDHPQIAPESRGDLFDGTEIEEALLLHLRVLSDGERAEIAAADPAVRRMVARADATTSEEILALHGRVTLRDPETTEPPSEPPGLPDPRAGEETAEVGGRQARRGGRVILHPVEGADLQARMLAGRTATLERIFTAYDGRQHFGVTIDDDPGQKLMRDTGRYLYFFADEIEVIQ